MVSRCTIDRQEWARHRACTCSRRLLCMILDRVGAVRGDQWVGNGQTVGGREGWWWVGVPERRARLKGGTFDELSTCTTHTDDRPIEVLRGGIVQAGPSSEMFLDKRPFPGLLPAPLLLCSQPSSASSEVCRTP